MTSRRKGGRRRSALSNEVLIVDVACPAAAGQDREVVHSGRGEPAEIGKLRVPLPQRFERVVVRDEEPAQAEVPQSWAVVPFLPSPLGHREQQRDKFPGERLRLARKGGCDKRRVALTVDGEERGAPDLRQR